MKIQLLYFAGCPSWQPALQNLQTALREEGTPAELELIEVIDEAQAARLKFLGSPQILVNGVDLWPEERRGHYGLSCRLYATPEGMRGFPTVAMLRRQLQRFREA